MGAADFCGFNYFFICSVGTCITDIFENGSREEVCLLRNNCNVSAKIVEGDIFDIDIVDINAAFFYIVQADKKIGKRALS